MEYKRIVAVTGLPGLYELVSSKSDGAIVRCLNDNSTKFVSSRVHNLSHLESIEVYTTGENVNLADVFTAVKNSSELLPDVKDNKQLKNYFERIYPELDFERVYASDMKKMIKWYEELQEHNVEIKLTEEDLTPTLSTSGEGDINLNRSATKGAANVPKYNVRDRMQFENARRMRKGNTEAENTLWQYLRNNQLEEKFRRQHPVDGFITDFVCLQKKLIIEIDGGYHQSDEQKIDDADRTAILKDIGFKVLRFTNNEVLFSIETVLQKIKEQLKEYPKSSNTLRSKGSPSPPVEKGWGIEVTPLSTSGEGLGVRCYTTRPDTIFGVDFMVLAPEHDLVEQITTSEQKKAVEEYIAYVKSRTERDRVAEKKITGVFTGAYAQHPFTEKQIPVWISEYVLISYGTGAIMGVPSGDERDHKFAKHFNIPITNIFGDAYNGEEAIIDKNAVLYNSDFLNGMTYNKA
ncbi:MAG: DUF559 domain-containing protein, partial [Chitinophagaceae bacterium]